MPYPGGKGRCYQTLISLMPPHRAYIETHLGSGAVMRFKRPADVNIGIERDPNVLAQLWHAPPSHLKIVNADALEFIQSYDFCGDELIYCDPPYLLRTRRRQRIYRFDYEEHDHSALLAVLKAVGCHVILSGYPSRFYDLTLTGWLRFDRIEQTQAGPRTECIWTNYKPPILLHDHSYIGRTFREREAIRRRRTSILGRIQSLTEMERSALICEIARTQPDAFLKIAETLR